ncbi:MAG: OmpA family protein [Deltaproteobacteria bacterium]|nr:OmpA family protein [Deltaproteobacteria bacterium]
MSLLMTPGFLVFLSFNLREAYAQDKYVVQIMSLSSAATARSEADRLMSLGVPSFQREEEAEGLGIRYRVYVGPFDSAAEAKAAAEALKSQKLVKNYFVRKESASPAGAATVSPPPATSSGAATSGSAGTSGSTATTGSAPTPLGSAPATPSQGPPAATQSLDDGWGEVPVLSKDSQASGATPTPTQSPEYWPLPNERKPVVGNTDPRDWPPPGQDDNDWGAPKGGSGSLGASVSPSSSGASPGSQPPAPQTTKTPAQPSQSPASNAGSIPSAPPKSPPSAKPEAPTVNSDFPATTPVLPGEVATNSSAFGATSRGGATIIPAKPTGPMKIKGFVILFDLSSSMRDLSSCSGRLVKEEAATILTRRINQRIPSHPYIAALRVFGYKRAWTRKDYTTLYYGPTEYNRGALETAIGRLYAADSISPFGSALAASEAELSVMDNPRAILMVSDFEETADPGEPANKAASIRRKYGQDTKIYAFYVSNQKDAAKLAQDVAKAGGGQAYDICNILDNEAQFEKMASEIFGPRDVPPCRDSDSDGVCDDRDKCSRTPKGAPVDERGCWIAAFAQFFDYDKAEVKYAFQPRLKAAAEILVQNPHLAEVVIAGHTDNKGSEKYNQELGLKRAEAVKELLIKFGAPAAKLKTVSYGLTQPIAPNDTEENRAKNRRVEFHVGDGPAPSK